MDRNNTAVMNIGRRIAEERQRAGLTQSALAEKLGLATVTIRQYERGVREPKIDTLRKIAEVISNSGNPIDVTCFIPTHNENPIFYDRVKEKLSPDEIDLLDFYDWSGEDERLDLLRDAAEMLTPEGQRIAIKRVREMVELAKYRKPELKQAPQWPIDGIDNVDHKQAAPQPAGEKPAEPAPKTGPDTPEED
mgnify:FL=1